MSYHYLKTNLGKILSKFLNARRLGAILKLVFAHHVPKKIHRIEDEIIIDNFINKN